MKQLILILVSLSVGLSVLAQQPHVDARSERRMFSSKRLLPARTIVKQARTTSNRQVNCPVDTLWYATLKNIDLNYSAWELTSDNAQAAGQWFEAPSPVTIHGVGIWAFVDTIGGTVTADFQVEVYNAGTNKLPIGPPVASTTVTFDTTGVQSALFVDEFFKRIEFPAPVTVNGDYVVSFTNLSSTAVVVYFAGDDVSLSGQGEFNAMLRFGPGIGDWDLGDNITINLSNDLYDIDHTIFPFVSVNYDVSLQEDTCVLFDNPTRFISTSDAIASSRFYNVRSFVAFFANEPDSTIFWDFDDDRSNPITHFGDTVFNTFPQNPNGEVNVVIAGSIVPFTSLFYDNVSLCADIDSALIKAELLPNAAFSVNQLSPFEFSFTNPFANESYLWDFGDGNTSTLPNPTHTYTTPGLTQVRLVTTTCGVSDTFVVSRIVNRDPAAVSAFRIHPNPVSDQLTISWETPTAQVAKIRLLDAMGRLVHQAESPVVSDYQLHMDLSTLPVGVYLLTLEAGEQQWVERIVVE